MNRREPAKPTRIQSVSRGVDALRLVASGPEEGRSVIEIANALERPLASVYHLLNTLVEEGMLAKDAARKYHLGPTVASLGGAYSRRTQPSEEIIQRLRELAAATGESTYFSSWRHGEIVVMASVEGSHAVRVSELQHGFAGAAHARASGKLLLAYLEPDALQRYLSSHPLSAVTPRTITSESKLFAQLDQVRKLGYASDVGEFKEGVACISGPALHEGAVVGAYTLSSPVDRFRRQRRNLIEAILATSRSDLRPGRQLPSTRRPAKPRSVRPPRVVTLREGKS